MSTTGTKERSTDGSSSKPSVPEDTSGSSSMTPGETRPQISHASFALFLSFIAVLMSLGALLAVAFKLNDTQSGGTQATGTPSAAQSQPATSAPAGGSVQVGAGDDFFKPTDVTASAGKVDFEVVNSGKIMHELVLAKTNADPAQLPTKPDGSVDEPQLNSPGEVPDVAPGTTKHGTIKLDAGRYVMFCNIPGHYAAGMYGTVTAK